MRKTIPLLLILTGAVLSACGGGSPIGPQPTYTLLPTYTPLPTFTPLPQSTATATFMPSPTPPEEAEESADLPPSATPNTGFEVTLAFGSNLRAGPGTTYETITFLEAGEVLSVQGRDVNGGWIFGETSTGQSGWVRITQIEGRLDIGLIPLAETIPTPEATTTAVADAGDEDTTPEPTEEGDEDDEDDDNGEEGGADLPADDPLLFELVAGGVDVCRTLTVVAPGPFVVEDINAPLVAFDAPNAPSIPSQQAYLLDRTGVPDFIEVFVDGDATLLNCSETDNTCTAVEITLCAFAFSGAPTGGFLYEDPVVLEVGTQSYDELFEAFEAILDTTWIVTDGS